MRKTFPYWVLMMLSTFSIAAQNILTEYDSLPIEKPKPLSSIYNVNHSSIHEISIKTKEPKALDHRPAKFWDNLAGGFVTLMSGINTTSSEETIWVMQNELNSTNAAYSWQVPLFFSGEYVKNRERVKNDDGSTSMETKKGVYVDWNKGASGLIIEKGDTLGSFDLATNLQEDSTSLYWLDKLRVDSRNLADKLNKFGMDQVTYNLRAIGSLRGKSFYTVTSANHFRSVIIVEGEPSAIFQSDPNYVILKKKDRISPYMLFASHIGEDERTDLIRLAFLNSLLSQCVNVDFYDK